MPYAKKRRSAGSGLLPGVRKLARAVNSEIRDQKAVQEAAQASLYAQQLTQAPNPQNWLQGRIDARRKYGGMGMYTGHGGFFGDLGHAAFDRIGPTGLGDLGQLGRGLGNAFGKWAGVGAYGEGAANSLIPNGPTGIGVPAFASSGGESGSVCITHREYVGDIFGNASGQTFVIQSYALNPGLTQTFPWLSQLASNYDEYTFKQLMFSYRSVISDIGSSTTGQVGTIIMATNYNAAAQPFPDKQTMMEYEAAMSAKTTEHQLHGIECDNTKKSFGPEGLYVRTNPVLVGQDTKTYDWGKFQLAVSNTPTTSGSSFANQIIGELWVSYTVELRKPKYFVNRGLGLDRDTFATSAIPTSANLFPALLTGQQNNIGVLLTSSGTAGAPVVTLTFPANYAGAVRVLLIVGATVLTGATQTTTLGGNVLALGDIIQGSSVLMLNGNNAISYIGDFNIANAANGTNNTVTITFASVTLTGGLRSQLDVVELNPSGLPSITSQQNVLFVNSSGVVTASA